MLLLNSNAFTYFLQLMFLSIFSVKSISYVSTSTTESNCILRSSFNKLYFNKKLIYFSFIHGEMLISLSQKVLLSSVIGTLFTVWLATSRTSKQTEKTVGEFSLTDAKSGAPWIKEHFQKLRCVFILFWFCIYSKNFRKTMNLRILYEIDTTLVKEFLPFLDLYL